MAAPAPRPPRVQDIAIPTPPPRDQQDQDALLQFLWQFSRSGIFNATLARQDRAILLALYGMGVVEAAIAPDATVIANPPTQANVQALQATINKLVAQVNSLSVVLGALVDAINQNLKSLPAATTGA